MMTDKESRHGKIKEGNTRICLVVPQQLKDELSEQAQREQRTVSNLIVKVLTEYSQLNKDKRNK